MARQALSDRTIVALSQAVLAFVTLREGSLTGAQVEAALGQSLPPYAVPQVLCVDWIPLLVNGKVDRQALLRSYAESFAVSRGLPDYTGAPDGMAEAARVLLDTVAGVLGAAVRAKISLRRSFYELGGNSLNSVLTVTRLREQGFFVSEYRKYASCLWLEPKVASDAVLPAGVSDFIGAESLGKALECMKPSEADASMLAESLQPTTLRADILSERHKQDVYRCVTRNLCLSHASAQCPFTDTHDGFCAV